MESTDCLLYTSRKRNFSNNLEENNRQLPAFWEECRRDQTLDKLSAYQAAEDIFGNALIGMCLSENAQEKEITYAIGAGYHGEPVGEGLSVEPVSYTHLDVYKRQDPYHHLLSNHNCLQPWDFSRPNITHVCYQTKCFYYVPELLEKYKKPVMIDECCYEGNLPMSWGNISAWEMVKRFWRVVSCGGYCTHGETFEDEKDVLWWARGGVLNCLLYTSRCV